MFFLAINWGELYTLLQPLLVVIVSIIATALGGKFLVTATDRHRAEIIDKMADNMLELIRINNPGNPTLERIQEWEDKLFEAIMASGKTSSPAVARRVAAANVAKMVRAEGGPA